MIRDERLADELAHAIVDTAILICDANRTASLHGLPAPFPQYAGLDVEQLVDLAATRADGGGLPFPDLDAEPSKPTA